MKTISQISRNLLVVLTIATLASLPTLSFAQEQVKGAQKLIQLNAIKTSAAAQAVQPGDLVVMSCPKCKDSWVTVVEPATKTGVKAETKVVARHECPGCKNQLVTEGHGKAKTAKLVHSCKQCSDASGCVTMKDVD